MSDCEMQDTRIEAILGEDNLDVSDESLILYRSYLQKSIVKPCELKCSGQCEWENYYIFGLGDKKEYEELRKSRPSCKDIFMFMSFDTFIDDTAGLMVKVKRVSDRKQFVMPLADLEATDEKSSNYKLIDDYAYWYVNY